VGQAITIQVSATERAELESLVAELGAGSRLLTNRPFDGATLVAALVTLTTAGLPVLRSWLLGRSIERRSTKVTVNGRQFEGYSAEDVTAILNVLDKHMTNDQS
jgi:hypothetical protein